KLFLEHVKGSCRRKNTIQQEARYVRCREEHQYIYRQSTPVHAMPGVQEGHTQGHGGVCEHAYLLKREGMRKKPSDREARLKPEAGVERIKGQGVGLWKKKDR